MKKYRKRTISVIILTICMLIAVPLKLAKSDPKTQIILDNDYEYIETISDETYVVMKKNKLALFNKENDFLTDFIYDEILLEADGIYKVKKDGKYGLISDKKDSMINPAFEDIIHTNNGLITKLGGKYGVVSTSGDILIDYEYDMIFKVDDGFILNKDKESFYSNGTLKYKFNEYYDYAEKALKKGEIIVRLNGNYGVIDKHENIILPACYNLITCDYGYKLLSDDGYTIYETDLLDLEYIDLVRADVAIIKEDGLYGLKNLKGESILDTIYELIEIKEDKIYAYKNGKIKVYDIETKEFEEKLYDNIYYLTHGKITKDNDKWYYNDGELKIDESLNIIDTIGKYLVVRDKINKQMGVYNTECEEILPTKYKSITKISDTTICTSKSKNGIDCYGIVEIK